MDELVGAVLRILGGLALLIAGGELLVRGATRLAAALRLSTLFIGLTVVAFGTSAPELAVSVQSALAGSADIALGNVVGSNIFNVLFILGVSALIVPLDVSRQLIRRDVPLMVFVSLLLLVLGLDGRIGRIDGLLLFGGILVYTYASLQQSRRADASGAEANGEAVEYAAGSSPKLAHVGILSVGLILLVVGSRLLVGGSVTVATYLGVSQLIIGLTIVAMGTSLPEVVTSIMAAWRGERDIAVGNIVGSNLFNILCVLGLSGLVAPEGIAVSPTALRCDIPVMIAVAIACLPIFMTGHKIARWEGAVFFFYYLTYTAYLVLDGQQSSFGRTLATGMVVFVLPLTALTLLIAVWRSLSARAAVGAAGDRGAEPRRSGGTDHDPTRTDG